MLRANRAGGAARQDVAQSRSVGTLHIDRYVDLLGEEERQIARERRLNAVCPLVQEDAVAAPDDRARIVERQRKSEPRRQAHGAGIQQPAAPSRFLGRDVRNRDQRQQRLRALGGSRRSRRWR